MEKKPPLKNLKIPENLHRKFKMFAAGEKESMLTLTINALQDKMKNSKNEKLSATANQS